MKTICKIFGHKWKTGWAGAKNGPFDAVSINMKSCERCGKTEYEYTTVNEILLPKAFDSTTSSPSEAAAETGLGGEQNNE